MTPARFPVVTVIIASSCEAKREAAIWRAVESAVAQECITVDLQVVVNGQRFDTALFERLKADARIAVSYLDAGSYPAAVLHGRTLVTNPFFAYLDDDDEFLPGALRMRIAPMLEDASVDFVATNGYLNADDGTGDLIAYRPSPDIEREPVRELLRANWMQNCGHLFRTSSVTLDYFDGTTKYYEWTLLAFKLSQRLRMKFIDHPTYRKHDSPESLYKSAGVVEGSIVVLDMLAAMNDSPSLRSTLSRLRCSAFHATSDFHRVAGNYSQAWKFHLRSLGHVSGWRHLPYTRKLLLPMRTRVR
ncbi:MAG: glycosyltransferase family A protein [Gemmatimonadaceae bacterium]